MKSTIFISATMLLALSALGEDLIRNPFWPQGYQGRRYPITETPRYPSVKPTAPEKVEVVSTNATAKASTKYTSADAENALWDEARSTMKFSDVFTFNQGGKIHQSIRINGRLYSNGDLISINHGPRRFTWKVVGAGTNGTVRLQRMRQRELTPEERNRFIK